MPSGNRIQFVSIQTDGPQLLQRGMAHGVLVWSLELHLQLKVLVGVCSHLRVFVRACVIVPGVSDSRGLLAWSHGQKRMLRCGQLPDTAQTAPALCTVSAKIVVCLSIAAVCRILLCCVAGVLRCSRAATPLLLLHYCSK